MRIIYTAVIVNQNIVSSIGMPVGNGTTSKVMYLGVVLDSKLTFREHVKEKCTKASHMLCALHGAVGKLWGPSPKNMLWVYEQVVRPVILHGAIVWGHRILFTWGR